MAIHVLTRDPNDLVNLLVELIPKLHLMLADFELAQMPIDMMPVHLQLMMGCQMLMHIPVALQQKMHVLLRMSVEDLVEQTLAMVHVQLQAQLELQK